MRKIVLFLGIAVTTLPLMAENTNSLFLPGAVALWGNEESIPAVGLSLKVPAVVFSEDSFIAYDAFEFRATYSYDRELYRVDVSWPNIWGFLYPGIAVELQDGETIPWFYTEVDVFYFPFFFAAIMIFEKPLFIPSVYFTIMLGAQGLRQDVGVRLSIPVGW